MASGRLEVDLQACEVGPAGKRMEQEVFRIGQVVDADVGRYGVAESIADVDVGDEEPVEGAQDVGAAVGVVSSSICSADRLWGFPCMSA